MRILVVEDETKVANALREGFDSEDFKVVIARTGEEAPQLQPGSRGPQRAGMRLELTASFLLFLLLGAGLLRAQPAAPLQLVTTIQMPSVRGRIDHMAVDLKGQRLFVSALGNDTVEVIDLRRGTLLHSIHGLDEPQGVLYLPGENRLYVANGGDGAVGIFDGASYRLLDTVRLGSDADNMRFDATTHRIYVAFGNGALAMIDPGGKLLGTIRLDAHPESFQIETTKIFVNLPDARQLAVIGRPAGQVSMVWHTGSAVGNFPMALDETDHRLFVVCRRPATLLVIDTDQGHVVASLPAVGDSDDVFYDAARRRLYASGGDGAISVYQQLDANHYRQIASLATPPGARTSLFSPQLDRLFLAVRRNGSQPAAIRVYRPE